MHEAREQWYLGRMEITGTMVEDYFDDGGTAYGLTVDGEGGGSLHAALC